MTSFPYANDIGTKFAKGYDNPKLAKGYDNPKLVQSVSCHSKKERKEFTCCY